tara:strand:- start:552 stop:797 length:246 start_codon:yes stop_codon:yes gene_type:complete
MQGKNGMFTPPRFSHVYALKTVSEENSKGSWHGWEISLNGPVEDANIYQSAKAFATSILAGEVNVKHQDESADVNSDDIPF